MGRLLENLRAGSDSHTVEELADGFVIVRAGGRFDMVVRDALNHSGNEFVVLPTTDGHGGYERAVILPL